MRISLLCAVAVLTLAGCSGSTADTHDADVKAIGDLESNWNAAYKARDMNKISANYADNAVLMAPGMASLNGKDAITNDLKQMIADPAMDLTFHADRIVVSKSGDLAWSRGTYQMAMTDPATHKVVQDHGSYVTTYQKQSDGAWKAVADIATSEVPPHAAAPSHASHKEKKTTSHKHKK